MFLLFCTALLIPPELSAGISEPEWPNSSSQVVLICWFTSAPRSLGKSQFASRRVLALLGCWCTARGLGMQRAHASEPACRDEGRQTSPAPAHVLRWSGANLLQFWSRMNEFTPYLTFWYFTCVWNLMQMLLLGFLMHIGSGRMILTSIRGRYLAMGPYGSYNYQNYHFVVELEGRGACGQSDNSCSSLNGERVSAFFWGLGEKRMGPDAAPTWAQDLWSAGLHQLVLVGGFSPRYICTCWILLYVFGKSVPSLDVGINNSECFAGAFPNLALCSGPASAPFLVQCSELFTHASFSGVVFVN